jgi:predicted DNA-binding transcriptional regulator YafY
VSTERATGDDLDAVYHPAADDVRVKLRLEPSASWVVETMPTESVTPAAGGHTDVVLAISAPAFLERLLLVLGPAARVLDPPEAKSLVAAAAERVLRRYESAA